MRVTNQGQSFIERNGEVVGINLGTSSAFEHQLGIQGIRDYISQESAFDIAARSFVQATRELREARAIVTTKGRAIVKGFNFFRVKAQGNEYSLLIFNKRMSVTERIENAIKDHKISAVTVAKDTARKEVINSTSPRHPVSASWDMSSFMLIGEGESAYEKLKAINKIISEHRLIITTPQELGHEGAGLTLIDAKALTPVELKRIRAVSDALRAKAFAEEEKKTLKAA